MIKREELLGILKKALITEEKAIPIYTKHLDSAIFWTGFGEENVEKAKILLKKLAVDTARHREIVAGLIERVEKEKKDAF